MKRLSVLSDQAMLGFSLGFSTAITAIGVWSCDDAPLTVDQVGAALDEVDRVAEKLAEARGFKYDEILKLRRETYAAVLLKIAERVPKHKRHTIPPSMH